MHLCVSRVVQLWFRELVLPAVGLDSVVFSFIVL